MDANKKRRPEGLIKIRPVTIGIEVRVLESQRVLETVAEQTIEADVSGPDEGEQKSRRDVRCD